MVKGIIVLMKINLTSCGNTNHPNCLSLPPAKRWKRIKAEREAKLRVLHCALVFAEQKSPRSYPIRGPQQPEGDMDTSGAWKHELLEGEADCSWKGCSQKLQTGMWLASLTFLPEHGLACAHRYAFLCMSFFP